MQAQVGYLVPSFNHARYVGALLESIKIDAGMLDTTWELLIIDDGSNDDSQQVISDWILASGEATRIKFLARENRGLSATLNQLIATTGATYLRLCGSDDVVVPGSTARMLTFFSNRPKLFCVAGDGLVINENGEMINQSSVRYHGGDMAKLLSPATMPTALVRNWCLAGPALLIRKDYYNTMSYDENLSIDDFDLFLSLLSTPDSLLFVKTLVCHYRVHHSNTSKTDNRQKRIRNLQAFNSIISKHIDKGFMLDELIPLQRKTSAKIAFLENRYFSCILNLARMTGSRIRARWKIESVTR